MFVRNRWGLSLFLFAKQKWCVLQDCPFSSQRLKYTLQMPCTENSTVVHKVCPAFCTELNCPGIILAFMSKIFLYLRVKTRAAISY